MASSDASPVDALGEETGDQLVSQLQEAQAAPLESRRSVPEFVSWPSRTTDTSLNG